MSKLEQVYKIHDTLYRMKNEGVIIPDVVFYVIRDQVEEFMQHQHALERPETLDDEMPDDFDNWLTIKMDEDDLLAKILN